MNKVLFECVPTSVSIEGTCIADVALLGKLQTL